MEEKQVLLGKRLRQFRKSKNLTQQEFANMIVTSQGFLSEIESNKKMPGAEILISLKRCFDLDINWLLTGKIYIPQNGDKRLVNEEDIPKEDIKEWLDDFWNNASDEERVWLKIELQRVFPEFKKWLLNRHQVDTKK
ncbi:MAG: helix-turn-helix transcriptional regulator [Deltaproteobacteria bacterium]|nr:helix-turn-helix transcriptional regulator [Deltaproteobacteria bacterium]